jgi:hypothetical protein
MFPLIINFSSFPTPCGAKALSHRKLGGEPSSSRSIKEGCRTIGYYRREVQGRIRAGDIKLGKISK